MIEVIVSKKCSVAERICSFELIGINGPLPSFEAGAHIDVYVAPGVIRQYSLCNDPAESHRYVVGVLNDPASRGGSRGMHEIIKEGDRLHIGEPRNLFSLDPTATRHLLFAGGIGVTPILSMARQLHTMGAEFEMHYCARSRAQAAFVDVIETAPFADRVQFHFDDAPAQQKLDSKTVLSQPAAGVHVYVCGPSGFMDHVLDTARQQGWHELVLHREYFVAPKLVDAGAEKPFEMHLKRSKLVLQVPAELTALQVLEAAGVAVESSCEQGICGSCLTPVLDGVPDHRDQFLTDDERALNDQFTPCCSRAKSARLVLDI